MEGGIPKKSSSGDQPESIPDNLRLEWYKQTLGRQRTTYGCCALLYPWYQRHWWSSRDRGSRQFSWSQTGIYSLGTQWRHTRRRVKRFLRTHWRRSGKDTGDWTNFRGFLCCKWACECDKSRKKIGQGFGWVRVTEVAGMSAGSFCVSKVWSLARPEVLVQIVLENYNIKHG